ncbi:MAG: hypothetical protein ACTTH6_01340 [Candidatus Altimarinota bacterium]
MRKLFLLILTLLFPLSAFAQNENEYTMKVETDSVIYNEDSKKLEIPFYFIKDNGDRLNPDLLLNTPSCGSDYTWWDDSRGLSTYVQFDGKKVKDGLLYATFNFSESSIPGGHKLILRFTNFLGCNFSQGTIKYENEQDYFTWTIPNDKNSIFGCTNSSSPNYNPQATDDDGTCIDSRLRPQNITGFFETSKVNHGATTWTITLNTSIENAFLDISKIQTWNKFTPVSFYNQDKKIIITIKQFDDKRLDVECTNYELTVPKNALTTSNGDKNDEAITGNFIVENCPTIPANSDDSDNSGTGAVSPEKDAELNSQSTYMPLVFRKDGVFYLDFKAFGLMALYFFLIFSFGYIIFKFFKK